MGERDARQDSVWRWAFLRAHEHLGKVIVAAGAIPTVTILLGAAVGNAVVGVWVGLGVVGGIVLLYTFLGAPIEQRNALRRELESLTGRDVDATISVPEEIVTLSTGNAWSLYVNVQNVGAEGVFWATAHWIHDRKPMHAPWKVRWGGTADKRHLIGPGEPNTLHLLYVTRTHGGALARPLKSTDPLAGHQDKKDPLGDEMGVCLYLYREGAREPLQVGLRFKPHDVYHLKFVIDDSILPEA